MDSKRFQFGHILIDFEIGLKNKAIIRQYDPADPPSPAMEMEDNIDEDYDSSSSFVIDSPRAPGSGEGSGENEENEENGSDSDYGDMPDLIPIHVSLGTRAESEADKADELAATTAATTAAAASTPKLLLVSQPNMSQFESIVHEAALNTIAQLKRLFRSSNMVPQNPNTMVTDVINVLSTGDLRICIHGATQPARIQSTEANVYEKVKALRQFMGPMNVWVYFGLNHLLVLTDFASICSSTLFSSIYKHEQLPSMVRDTMMFMHGCQGPEVIVCNLDARSVALYDDEDECHEIMIMVNYDTNCVTRCPEDTGEWWMTYSHRITFGQLQAMARPRNTNVGTT